MSQISRISAACILLLLGIVSSSPAWAYENPILGYTHLLPSPYTLPAGRFVLGTDVAFGITDSLQIGSNILYDAFKVFNANAKLSLIDLPGFSFGLTFGFQTYNLRDLDSSNPDIHVTAYLPGAVAGIAITQELGLLVGGSANLTSQTFSLNGLTTSAYTHGANVESDVSWAVASNKGWPTIVLSGGGSYDFTYQLAGVGASMHIHGFHFGAHYYPAATQNKVLPIIAGGAAVDL
jgi:hypothetical protein